MIILTASEFRNFKKTGKLPAAQLAAKRKKRPQGERSAPQTCKDKGKDVDRALKGLKTRRKCAAKTFIETILQQTGQSWQQEYVFSSTRLFRFDYALPEKKLAIEYEGLISQKSRHMTIKGYTGDCDKYNLAVSLGWKVFRFTALNYKTVIDYLPKYG
jgi:hypothetical protein